MTSFQTLFYHNSQKSKGRLIESVSMSKVEVSGVSIQLTCPPQIQIAKMNNITSCHVKHLKYPVIAYSIYKTGQYRSTGPLKMTTVRIDRTAVQRETLQDTD